MSREELFALVWEKPTVEVAKELGAALAAGGRGSRRRAGRIRPRLAPPSVSAPSSEGERRD